MMKRVGLAALGAVLVAGCADTRFVQNDLGELPTPVLIRTVTWNVDGFRRADGRKDVAAFAKVIREAKPDFAVLTGVGRETNEVARLGAELGLVASWTEGVGVLSRIRPEETWPTKGQLIVEQPDFSITAVDFGAPPAAKTVKHVMNGSGRGKSQFFCAWPHIVKGSEAYATYEAVFRPISDGIGIIRTWGAGGFTLYSEERLGGAAFRNPAHLVVVKD